MNTRTCPTAPRKASFHFPFSAIVGQESMKKAFILHAIDPLIGGVLVRGEKGTAKSTLIRSLTGLLPTRIVQADCPYGCSTEDLQQYPHLKIENKKQEETNIKVIDLPLNTTDDRLVGALDLDAALQGQFHFRPGILAQAHGNWLYIDEVNLLEDHLVDMLLDCAALGENIVEREGMSIRHPCRFVLVGSMNPEEGELRPQLLDRFGLVVDVEGEKELSQRVEILRRCLAYEQNPQAMMQEWESQEQALKTKLIQARNRYHEVMIPDHLYELCSRITLEMDVDGHRADLAMIRAAKAMAAWQAQKIVQPLHLFLVAPLALPHRMQRKKFSKDFFEPSQWSHWIQHEH